MVNKISLEENRKRKRFIVEALSLDLNKKEDIKFLRSLRDVFARKNSYPSREFISSKISEIMTIYNITVSKTLKLIRYTPNVLNYNHKINLTSLSNFLDLPINKTKELFLAFPSIYTNFEVKFNNISKTYGVSKEITKNLIKNFPQFISFDHEKRLKNIELLYGVSRKQAIERVLNVPRFLSINHTESLKVNKRLGKLFSLYENEIKEFSWKYYRFSGMGSSKKIAIIDSLRNNREIIENIQANIIAKHMEGKTKATIGDIRKETAEAVIKWVNNSGREANPYVFIEKLKEKYPKGVRETIAKRHAKKNVFSKLSDKFTRSRLNKRRFK
ncbi:MAG: hypothetical protein PHN22_03210 [Candidatus ainarchaeum sp.]|nr:hypothetical protein [Candidatus ainarchaeum sp.]